MTRRLYTWFIPTPEGDGTRQGPTYYAEQALSLKALRIYARVAPGSGPLLVDIKADGVSVMNAPVNIIKSPLQADGVMWYGTLAVSTFSAGETISGTTSSVTATVTSDDGEGKLTFVNASGNFTVGETITGTTSGATAVVHTHEPATAGETITTTTGQSQAMLDKGENATTMAADFTGTAIPSDSWLSCDLLDSGGAKDITIQLEADALADDDEATD